MAEEIIKARIVFDTSGIGKIASQSIGNQKGGLMGAASSGLGFGKMAGAVGLGVGAGLAVLEGIKKLMGKIVESSPKLQATLSILSKSLSLILRPIGDAIGMVLRPVAILLLQYAIKSYKVWKDFVDKFKIGEGLPGAVGELGKSALSGDTKGFQEARDKIIDLFESIGGLSNIAGLAVDVFGSLTGVFKFLWGAVKGIAGILVLLGEAWLYIADKVLDPMMPIINAFSDALLSIGQFFSDVGTAIWDLAMGGSWDAFLGSLTEAWDKFKENMGATWSNLWEEMKATAAEKRAAVGKFFEEMWASIQSGWETAVGAIKTFFTETIPGWWDTVIDKLTAAWRIVKSIFSRSSGSSTGNNDTSNQDVFIQKDGTRHHLANDDNIVAYKGNSMPGSGGGQTNNITISLSALDASSINRSVLDKIAQSVTDALRRGMTARSTEVFGGF